MAAEVEAAHSLEVAHDVAAAMVDRSRSRTPSSGRTIVIGGLPRTGTSFLHALLVRATGYYAPRSYETYDPLAGLSRPERPSSLADAREAAEQRFAAMRALAPKLQQMHPLTADGIEECTPLLQHSFRCPQWIVMFGIPTYQRWLSDREGFAAMDLWRDAHDLILDGRTGAGRPAGRALKSPLFAFDYEALVTAEPRVTLVHVCRSPADALRSWLNLIEATQVTFLIDVDPSAVGRLGLDLWRVLVSNATTAVEHRSLIVHRVSFRRLTVDPVAAYDSLADQIGLQPVDVGPMVPRAASETNAGMPVNLNPLDHYGLSAAVADDFAAEYDPRGIFFER